MKNLRESKNFAQKREPIQLELFSEITSKNLYRSLAQNNKRDQTKFKKPVEIEPVDCDVW